MIFRAYASKNPGVWGRPQGALLAQIGKTEIANLQFLRFSYCLKLRPSLLLSLPFALQMLKASGPTLAASATTKIRASYSFKKRKRPSSFLFLNFQYNLFREDMAKEAIVIMRRMQVRTDPIT